MITEAHVSEETVAMARGLYEAYIANSGGLNYQGLPCPTWENLTPAIRGHWCATACEAHARILAMLVTKPKFEALKTAWEAIPDEGRVPDGVGAWLQPLINAATDIVNPDYAHKEPT